MEKNRFAESPDWLQSTTSVPDLGQWGAEGKARRGLIQRVGAYFQQIDYHEVSRNVAIFIAVGVFIWMLMMLVAPMLEMAGII